MTNLAESCVEPLARSKCPNGVLRVGAVPYLNAWPVTWGLGKLANWDTSSMVPSDLAEAFAGGAIDLALGSSIDALRLDPAPIVLPVAPIASDGPTLTVKIASQVPAESITTLHCDTDSHTSVALATILLRDVWGIDPPLEPFDARAHRGAWPESVLLIGDKVITDPPPAGTWRHEIDLGEVWTRTTGLPFVFAVWMLHPSRAHAAECVCAVLDRQQRFNRMRFDAMVAHGANDHGWPVELARNYLARHLTYRFDTAHRAGLECFITKCREHDLVDADRQLVLHTRFGGR